MNRIKELRNLQKIKQIDFCKQLGVSQSTLSGWENEKYDPDINSIKMMCNIFNVTTDYLLGQTNYIICNDCGFCYDPLFKLDNLDHQIRHSKWEKANEKFGFCYMYSEANKIKDTNRKIINNPESSDEEIYNSYIEYQKGDFSISLNNSFFSLKHVTFEEYISINLDTQITKDLLPENVYSKLLNKYGITPNNSYHYESNNYSDKKIEHLLYEFEKLNELGKDEAINRIEELTNLIKYTLE